MQRKSALHQQSHYQIAYDDLIAKHASLTDLIQQSALSEQQMIVKAILIGANELILRQDEMGVDFTIAIVTLLDIASEELVSGELASKHQN